METDDPQYYDLKQYHDELSSTLENFSTDRISKQVDHVIADMRKIDEVKQAEFSWSQSDMEQLIHLTAKSKTLRPPKWPWNASEDTRQGRYESRMQLVVQEELKHKILTCPDCGVTALLVGPDQI